MTERYYVIYGVSVAEQIDEYCTKTVSVSYQRRKTVISYFVSSSDKKTRSNTIMICGSCSTISSMGSVTALHGRQCRTIFGLYCVSQRAGRLNRPTRSLTAGHCVRSLRVARGPVTVARKEKRTKAAHGDRHPGSSSGAAHHPDRSVF